MDGFAFDDAEPDLDQVEPGPGSRGEMDVDPRVRREPLPHLGVFVGGVVCPSPPGAARRWRRHGRRASEDEEHRQCRASR